MRPWWHVSGFNVASPDGLPASVQLTASVAMPSFVGAGNVSTLSRWPVHKTRLHIRGTEHFVGFAASTTLLWKGQQRKAVVAALDRTVVGFSYRSGLRRLASACGCCGCEGKKGPMAPCPIVGYESVFLRVNDAPLARSARSYLHLCSKKLGGFGGASVS